MSGLAPVPLEQRIVDAFIAQLVTTSVRGVLEMPPPEELDADAYPLPFVWLSTPDEVPAPEDVGTERVFEELPLMAYTVYQAKREEDLRATGRALAAEMRAAVMVDPSLGQLNVDLREGGMRYEPPAETSVGPLGRLEVEWVVTFQRARSSPYIGGTEGAIS